MRRLCNGFKVFSKTFGFLTVINSLLKGMSGTMVYRSLGFSFSFALISNGQFACFSQVKVATFGNYLKEI